MEGPVTRAPTTTTSTVKSHEIPRFFFPKKPAAFQHLLLAQREARTLAQPTLAQRLPLLQYKATCEFWESQIQDKILDTTQLNALWIALYENSFIFGGVEGQEQTFLPAEQAVLDEKRMIRYKDFKRVASTFPAAIREYYFKPCTFLRMLVPESMGAGIYIHQFYNYVSRRVTLFQSRLELSRYDEDKDGYLTHDELSTYIRELMPQLDLASLNASFTNFYVCGALKKFAFFLDPKKRGKIGITNILLSPILTELLEIREPDLPEEYERTNWFSAYTSLRVYGQFLLLDSGRDGMLSKEELAGYNSGTLTTEFLDRIFDECQTYRLFMDYKAFLDLILVLENPKAPESIAWCFKILDVQHRGYLDASDIIHFIRGILQKMAFFGHPPLREEDILYEIFDMVKASATEQRITLPMLVESGVGGTITSMLLDAKSFWQYENRESIIPNE